MNLRDRRLRLGMFLRHLRRYITGEDRCGYCGMRAWRWRRATQWGCYHWITCRRCWEREPFCDERPPYFATKRNVTPCAGCEDGCGIDAPG